MSILKQFTATLWQSLYSLIHIIFSLSEIIGIKWKDTRNLIYSKQHTRSSSTAVEEIKKLSNNLPKVPKHIAISLALDQNGSKNIDIKALVKLLNWTWAANIRVVSLYDHPGFIKETQKKLKSLLQQEINQNINSAEQSKVDVQFHNISTNAQEEPTGLKKLDTPNTFHVIVFSYEDGKSRIVKTVRNVSERNSGNITPLSNDVVPRRRSIIQLIKKMSIDEEEITEARLDTLLGVAQDYDEGMRETGISMEPDLLVILGNIRSTLGFLPWHIRLTEIHWIPALPHIDSSDFMNALNSFAGCEQRVGK